MSFYICDGCGEFRNHHDSPCSNFEDFESVVCEDCFNTLTAEAEEAKQDCEEAENRARMQRVADMMRGEV